MKKILLCLMAILMCANTVLGATISSDWAKDVVESANIQGIMPESFYLDDCTIPVTRVQVAQIVTNAYINNFKYNLKENDSPFDDTSSIYAAAVYDLAIMNGKGDGIFDPHAKVTREEMAKIILAYKSACEDMPLNIGVEETEFADNDQISTWAKPYVATAVEFGIINGFDDGTFRPKDTVSAEQVFALVQRAYLLNDKEKPEICDLDNNSVIDEDIEIIVDSEDEYTLFAKKLDGGYVTNLGTFDSYDDCEIDYDRLSPDSVYDIFVCSNRVFSDPVRIYTDSYSLVVNMKKFIESDIAVIDWNRLPDVENYEVIVTETRAGIHEMPKNQPVTYSVYGDDPIKLNVNPGKLYEISITGGEYCYNGEFYTMSKTFADQGEIYDTYPQSEEEAKPLMVDVKIPVWRLKNGKKVAGTTYVTVHYKIADKVEKIFQEIFEGPEQFPIKDIGGYSWRGGRTEHNGGTAIDINYDENYCIYNNGTTVGTCWSPFENPYSITPYGDVVKAFEKYGFTWGADSWSNPRDFMHFSYLGT